MSPCNKLAFQRNVLPWRVLTMWTLPYLEDSSIRPNILLPDSFQVHYSTFRAYTLHSLPLVCSLPDRRTCPPDTWVLLHLVTMFVTMISFLPWYLCYNGNKGTWVMSIVTLSYHACNHDILVTMVYLLQR